MIELVSRGIVYLAMSSLFGLFVVCSDYCSYKYYLFELSILLVSIVYYSYLLSVSLVLGCAPVIKVS